MLHVWAALSEGKKMRLSKKNKQKTHNKQKEMMTVTSSFPLKGIKLVSRFPSSPSTFSLHLCD